ncbi:MAG: cupredoxin domain-containing protein [Alphaproteobacteria bacterium]|nr:cupredoxin domain-containing protein [Alphaproteobacteria bacterium]
MIKTLFAVLLISIASAVQAQDEISITIKDHRFAPAEITIPANQRVKLTVRNEDATPEEMESVDLNFEKIIPGSEEGVIYIRPQNPGAYHFFGDFHQDTAQGVINAR